MKSTVRSLPQMQQIKELGCHYLQQLRGKLGPRELRLLKAGGMLAVTCLFLARVVPWAKSSYAHWQLSSRLHRELKKRALTASHWNVYRHADGRLSLYDDKINRNASRIARLFVVMESKRPVVSRVGKPEGFSADNEADYALVKQIFPTD